MIVGNKNRLGMITVELAVSLVLIAVVIFVTLGLFSDNLKEMVGNGNFKNVFSKDDSTFFSKSSMDYASSQITVQVMGEQGLLQLRRKANNNAIPLIENPFDDTNSNGNQIGYLVTIINGIVGDPDICVQMLKESDKKCSEDGIGGYKYLIDMSSSALTIKKVDVTGATVSETVILTLNNSVANALSGAPISVSSFDTPAASPGGTVNKDSSADKYMNAMKNIGDSLKSYGVTSILFGNSINVFKSQARLIAETPTVNTSLVTTPTVSTSIVSTKLAELLSDIGRRLSNAVGECDSYFERFEPDCWSRVEPNDVRDYNAWQDSKMTQLDSFVGTAQELLAIIATDSSGVKTLSYILNMMYDNDLKKDSYINFKNGIREIESDYSLNSGINWPH